MPSATDLIFLGLLFSLSCSALASRLLGDAGIGWHIRNGQLMLQNHAITRTDPFSSTMAGQPWYAWEWLYDLLIAGVHHWMGLNGVVFVSALVIAAAFALMFRLTVSGGANLPLAVLLLALALGAAAIHLLARPHVLSWLLVVVWFALLDGWESGAGSTWNLFWLPLSMLLWVNLHGGFLSGFILLGIYLVGGLVRYASGREPLARVGNLAAVTVLSLLASFANPYGYKLHEHIYGYLTNRFLMNHIEEFRSPDFHSLPAQCFVILLIIVIFTLVVSREKPRISQGLVMIFAAGSGLYSARNLPVSAVLLTLTIAPILSRAITNRSEFADWAGRLLASFDSFASRMARTETSLTGHLWPIAGALLGLVVCLHGGKVGRATQVMDAQFPAKRFPVRAVDLLAQKNLHEPVFCPDYWGGYLIYRLYPESEVVVDDRHDLYGEAFFKRYLTVVHVEPGWAQVLSELRVNLVLVPADSPLANALGESLGWRLVYGDKVGAVFQRNLT